jgi:hypothetical protein
MHIELTCQKCGEHLEADGFFLDNDTIEFLVKPCASFECTQPDQEVKDPEPLTMPYATLVRILDKKKVTVVYRKKNGDLRELTGFLGQLDSRTSGNLVYFHELVIATGSSCQVKCLTITNIQSVEHFEDGVMTLYRVLEAL